MGCEGDDKCCICIPIGIGVKILAVFGIIGAVWAPIQAFFLLEFIVAFIFFAVAAVIALYVGILYLKYLMADTQENRDNLPKAVVLSFLARIIIDAGTISLVYTEEGAMPAGAPAVSVGGMWAGVAIGLALGALITLYFYKVMIKYAASMD